MPTIPNELTVREVMQANPVAVRPDRTVGDLLVLMNQLRIGSVLVSDESERLIGIFTERDLLRRVSDAVVAGNERKALTALQRMLVDAQPPRLFSFRWTHPADQQAVAGNSLLVTFDLLPSGCGTLLKMTERGFRELGWEVAVLEQQYREHVTGWDFYLPRLAPYVATLPVRT